MEKKKVQFLLVILVTVFFVLLFVSMAIFFFQGAPVEGAEWSKLPGFKTYYSKKLGMEFDYPTALKVQEKNGLIAIEHSVPFEHYDPCDRKNGTKKLKTIRDFYMTIQMVNKSSAQILEEYGMNRENGAVVGLKELSHVDYGRLNGFRLYNGNYGCGPYAYFFPLSDHKGYYVPEKYLVIERYPASEFKEIPEEEKQMYSRLRLIILPEQEEHIFRGILSSLQWGGVK